MEEKKKPEVTAIVENYLGVILTLERDQIPATGAALVKHLLVSPPTVTNTFKRMIRDGLITMDGEKIVKSGLIDGLRYEDEVLDEKKEKTVSFSLYKETTSPLPFKGKNKVAVIFAQGEIHSGHSGGKSFFGSEIMGSDTISKYLRSARKNKSVKSVVLRGYQVYAVMAI